jgi:HK97 family phage portal protein
MGLALDILRGKVDQLPTLQPLATHQLDERAVVQQGQASATGGRLNSMLGDLLDAPSARDFKASAIAYRCVETIASNLASVDMTVLTNDEANDAHPVAQLWNVSASDAPVSARITRQVAFAQAELRGESFTFLDRGANASGPARAMWPIYDEMDVIVSGVPDNPHSQQVVGFVAKRDGQRFGLLPSEVLWLRYPHPTKRWGALAPWAAALGAAELDTHARAWQLGEFRNKAKPGMVIYLGQLTEQAHNAAVADFRSGVEGAHNAGKSLLVSGPQAANVSRLSLTAEEMSYLSSRAANRDEVALAFGIRPDYFVGQSTYENQRAAKTALWSDLLLGKMDVLGSEIDRQLLPDPAQQAGFDVSNVDALQENQDSIYNRLRGIAYTDALTLDEMRAQLGYEPLPNGAGQLTLTAYRSQISVDAQQQLAQLSAGEAARSVLPTPRRMVATRGRLVVPRAPAVERVTRPAVQLLAQRRTPLQLQSPRVLAFYRTHEGIGQRALRKLAERQQTIVLRKLSKLRTSQLASWAEHRAHAVDVAPNEVRVVDRELLGGVSPFTSYALSDDCTCERIAADDVFDVPYWREQTREQLDAFMHGVWEGAGARVAEGLGVSFDVFDQRVLDAMEARAVELASQVTETTRRAIDSQLLQVAAEEGWSIDDAADALRSTFTDLSGWRAEAIARTEVVGGYNAASNIAASSSGVVVARSWLTAEDERVRESHAAQNGQKLTDPGARYRNGLRFPGDPSGSPGETVNCRCVELFDVGD